MGRIVRLHLTCCLWFMTSCERSQRMSWRAKRLGKPFNLPLLSMRPDSAFRGRLARSGETEHISFALPRNACGAFSLITPAASDSYDMVAVEAQTNRVAPGTILKPPR